MYFCIVYLYLCDLLEAKVRPHIVGRLCHLPLRQEDETDQEFLFLLFAHRDAVALGERGLRMWAAISYYDRSGNSHGACMCYKATALHVFVRTPGRIVVTLGEEVLHFISSVLVIPQGSDGVCNLVKSSRVWCHQTS